MRIAVFGLPGPLTLAVLDAAHRAGQVVLVVRPPPSRPPPLRHLARTLIRSLGFHPDLLDAAAGARDLPVLTAATRADPAVIDALKHHRVEMICIAGYRWILPRTVWSFPRLGTVNFHTALLPAHRGPLPLFWIYHDNVTETGVSAHWVTDRVDAGDILAQEQLAVGRGEPVDHLNRRLGTCAGHLATTLLARIATGTTTSTPQDENMASDAPIVRPGQRFIDFANWHAERVWHFLAGLYPRWIEPLTTADGRPAGYRGVLGYERGTGSNAPGTLTPHRNRLALQCRDGIVWLRRPSRLGSLG